MGNVERKIISALVTGMGVGYFPLIPGTMGTLAAIPLSLAVNRVANGSLILGLLTLASLVFLSVWLATQAEVIFKQKDPAIVVIDEIAGFVVANFLAPPGILPLALAFVLFRIFDIGKTFPASKLAQVPGGAGIVLDDLVAGFYTFVILRLIVSWGLI